MFRVAAVVLVLVGLSCGGSGDGKTGDPCTNGSSCASGHCLNAPPDTHRYCTGECTTATDCAPTVPDCTDLNGTFSWAPAGTKWCTPR
jgi:hypothetical protein